MMDHYAPAYSRLERPRCPMISHETAAALASSASFTPTSYSIFRTARSPDDIRPSSPHNISSPISKFGDRLPVFSSVSRARSRVNSVESNKTSDTSTSYGDDTNAQPLSRVSDLGNAVKKAVNGSARNSDIINDIDVLKPDPGTEVDFEVENNKFAFSPGVLNKLLNPKSLSAFYAVGGLRGLEKGLRTNRQSGLSAEETTLDGTISNDELKPAYWKTSPEAVTDGSAPRKSATSLSKSRDGFFIDRKRVFSDNRLPAKKEIPLLQLMWNTYNDKVLILLSVAAAVILGTSFCPAFGAEHTPSKPRTECVEWVAIIVAVVTLAIVSSLNDYKRECQFVKLIEKKRDRTVKVMRSGRAREISIFDTLVGDVVLVEPGDVIPADGIFIESHNVMCDESQATGECDIVRKRPAEEVFAAIERGEDDCKLDPFALSGAQVAEGFGSFLVTSTGINSTYGKILTSIHGDAKVTLLESQLSSLAGYTAMLFRAPAFATTRMLKKNNFVHSLKGCELMGNATIICSDKTNTLTQTRITGIAGTKAVAGAGASDATVLKRADIGFSIGITATESAKQAPRTILVDNNLVSILRCLRLGRAIKDAAKRTLQFQVTINTTAILLFGIAAVSSSTGECPLTAVLVLWVNLIMDTMAALAIFTDPPTSKDRGVGLSRNASGFEEPIPIEKYNESKIQRADWVLLFTPVALLFTSVAFTIFKSIFGVSIIDGFDTLTSYPIHSLAMSSFFHVRLGDLVNAINCWITTEGPTIILTVLASLHLISDLNWTTPGQSPRQQYRDYKYYGDDGNSYLAAWSKVVTRALPGLNRQKNGYLSVRSASQHKRMVARRLATTLRCFMEQPISGFLILLPFIRGVAALDTPHPSTAPIGTHTDAYLKALFGGMILLLSTFFIEHIPSLFGILMGALSIAWIPIRNDPRTNPEVYWAVFASWGVSTIIYGFAQFSKKNMGQSYVLIALVITLALVGLNSQMHMKEDVVQGLIMCFPPMLSFSIFAVSHIPTLLGWIETLAIHLGTSIITARRLPVRRGEGDGDVEAGVLLGDTTCNSPAA